MLIQTHTDSTVDGDERLSEHVQTLVSSSLERFINRITRINVHLSDENGSKEGPKDHKCVMEARIENRQPLAVSHQADDVDHSIRGALQKLKRALDSSFGKMNQDRHRSPEPAPGLAAEPEGENLREEQSAGGGEAAQAKESEKERWLAEGGTPANAELIEKLKQPPSAS